MFGGIKVIRNLEGDTYRENFFVAAITSMLAIRFYLYLTGYPQIGGGGFHIAHMLWGGLLMMASLIIVFSFLNKGTLHIASILGGIGFGTFIDELGKFITSDNNYFFKPTVAIIYLLFVLLYISMKAIPKYPKISRKEYLINAFDLTQDVITNDLDKDEEKRALAYLRKAERNNPITKSLRSLLQEVDAISPPPPGFFKRTMMQFKNLYYDIANWRQIFTVVITVLIINVLIVIYETFVIIQHRPDLTFSEWGRFTTSILSGIFTLAGLGVFKISRLRGYQYFKFSVLITILLTQFFLFYQEQFRALTGLAFNIFLLLLVDFAIGREKEKIAALQVQEEKM